MRDSCSAWPSRMRFSSLSSGALRSASARLMPGLSTKDEFTVEIVSGTLEEAPRQYQFYQHETDQRPFWYRQTQEWVLHRAQTVGLEQQRKQFGSCNRVQWCLQRINAARSAGMRLHP